MNYYHYTGWDKTQIKCGVICETSWDVSYYWQNKLRGEFADLKTSTLPPFPTRPDLPKELSDSINQYMQKHVAPKLSLYSELLKEYIFEDIRAREFIGLPSRKKCLYLLPNGFHNEAAKRMGVNAPGKTLLEIETLDDSTIHTASFSELDCNALLVNEIEDHARRYWKGCKTVDANTEILYQGKFKVLAIH